MHPADAERLDRLARIRATQRERNRKAGIPDMELSGRHEPAEYFAQVGFRWVLERIGPTEPVQDWSDEGGDDGDRQEYLAARRRDHQRVADWLRDAEVKPIANRNGCDIGDVRVMWPDRVPSLKVWSGQQTLAKIVKQRQQALPKEVADVLACEAAISGSSGLYKPCATTALEDGFSVDALGIRRVTLVGMELLAIIGLETLPITVYPDRSIGYDAAEGPAESVTKACRYLFRVEDRNDYYGRWSTAERERVMS